MDYFKPFRRKIGFVTLVTALALMAGWMRSREYVDVLTLVKNDRVTHFCVSDREDVKWFVTTAPVNDPTLSMTRLGLKVKRTSELDANHVFAPIFWPATRFENKLAYRTFSDRQSALQSARQW